MYGSGAATGKEITAVHLRRIRKVQAVAPIGCSVAVAGTEGTAVFLTVLATLRTSATMTLASVSVFEFFPKNDMFNPDALDDVKEMSHFVL